MNKTGYMKDDFALTWGTEITHYVDANGGTNPHRKSISGYVFTVAKGVSVSQANEVTWTPSLA